MPMLLLTIFCCSSSLLVLPIY